MSTDPTPPATGRMRLAPEHFYAAAAEAWAGVQGDQIDAMDDQLRAAVGAVLDLVDENPAPRVDVDSLAIEGLTEKERQDFLAGPDVRPAVEGDVYAVALAAFKASGASRPHVVEVFVNEADLRAAVDAALVVERARIAAALRTAAAGRREYIRAGTPEFLAEDLEGSALVLDGAAEIAEGNDRILYSWLPSWRWTDEMRERERNG